MEQFLLEKHAVSGETSLHYNPKTKNIYSISNNGIFVIHGTSIVGNIPVGGPHSNILDFAVDSKTETIYALVQSINVKTAQEKITLDIINSNSAGQK